VAFINVNPAVNEINNFLYPIHEQYVNWEFRFETKPDQAQ